MPQYENKQVLMKNNELHFIDNNDNDMVFHKGDKICVWLYDDKDISGVIHSFANYYVYVKTNENKYDGFDTRIVRFVGRG